MSPKDNERLHDDLLTKVIAAHGGREQWDKIATIELTWNFSGRLLSLKGYPDHYQPSITVSTLAPRVSMQRLGTGAANPDNRWHLDGDRTWIEKRDGSITKNRDESRKAFAGHIRSTPWDELHLTYFVGYAMWNYLCTPFIFSWPGFTTRELEPHHERGQIWRVLEVTYPEGIPTHTKVQKFYFHETDFLLRRLDYTTDVAAGVVTHYCFDHKTFHGLVMPTFRRVVWRNGDDPAIDGPSSFLLDYVHVVVNEK